MSNCVKMLQTGRNTTQAKVSV